MTRLHRESENKKAELSQRWPRDARYINQSITFAMAPITGDHWRRTSNL